MVEIAARRTPAKFSMAHPIVRFGPGGHLLYVLPNCPDMNQPAIVEIHSVEVCEVINLIKKREFYFDD